jgi:hypothetical protein
MGNIIYTIREHDLTISGTMEDLLSLAEKLKDAEGTLGDVKYQIEYLFNVDHIAE